MRDLQIQTLNAVLDRVGQFPGVVVEIDLDLAALMPLVRTRRALGAVAAKTGISEFEDSDSLPILPGYSTEAWAAFLRASGLPERYPQLRWYDDGLPDSGPGTPFGWFHSAYWTTEWLIEDEAAPGLCAWVHRVEARGGRVVFISGRWLREHIAPTLECLRRAGIPDPQLVIGNDRHETLVGPERALSDAAVKAARQPEVRERFGEPVAFIDDRPQNRAAVLRALVDSVLPVAITIPKFTYDRDNGAAEWRISTFEMFDDILGDPPHHAYLVNRYGRLGEHQPWSGLHEGLGVNRQAYVVRRSAVDDDSLWRERLSAEHRPYAPFLKHLADGGVPEREFVHWCAQTIPPEVVAGATTVMDEASRLSDVGLGAPFPQSTAERDSLYHSLLVSWLHSRDIETVMQSLGFPLAAAGVHDVCELVPADEIKARIRHGGGSMYSGWLLDWSEQMPPGSDVNVGCFNPAMAVGMWRWRPGAQKEDAMDVHRLSSHHEGDGGERYDPIEAAVNNLLHRREGVSGIRKEPVETWPRLFERTLLPSGAYALGKTGIAVSVYRDLMQFVSKLEREGYITPWYAVLV